MKLIKYISAAGLILILTIAPAIATGILLTLEAKTVHCDLIAFIRVRSFHMTKAGLANMNDCVANCEITQGFKTPDKMTNVDLRFLCDAYTGATYEDLKKEYEGRTFLVFAFLKDEEYRPFGGAWALVEQNDHYWEWIKDDARENGMREKYFTHNELVKRLTELTGNTKNTQPAASPRTRSPERRSEP